MCVCVCVCGWVEGISGSDVLTPNTPPTHCLVETKQRDLELQRPKPDTAGCAVEPISVGCWGGSGSHLFNSDAVGVCVCVCLLLCGFVLACLMFNLFVTNCSL